MKLLLGEFEIYTLQITSTCLRDQSEYVTKEHIKTQSPCKYSWVPL